MKIKIYSSRTSLISSILFLLLGILMCSKPDSVIKWISYLIGSFIILLGIINYIENKKNKNNINMAGCIIAIVLGILCFILSSVFETAFRFIIGAWFLINGIQKLRIALNIINRRNNKFISSVVISAIFILLGLYIVIYSNLVISVLGIFMIIYSALEIISYITSKN